MLRGGGALAALALLGWAAAWLWRRGFDPRARPEGEAVWSAAELRRHSGTEAGATGLCLAVLGQVFDVRRGRAHYGPGGAYSFFAGKDASRAFATGDFTPAGLVDDISGLSPSELLTIHDWLSFYTKNYARLGKVAGRFYHEDGTPTEVLREAWGLIEEGRRLQAQEEERQRQFPSCNSEWSSTGGGRVWCSERSGGVDRDWAGVPRELYEPGSRRSRCVCADTGDLDDPNLREYEGCPPLSDWCALKD